MFKMPEYVWNTYAVRFKFRNRDVIKSLQYLDVVGEPRRRIGDSVTVNVNKQKRIGIIMDVVEAA